MVQLIITVIALSLTAATLLVTVNYLPSWVPVAKDTEALVESGARTLEDAFLLRSEDAGGVPPGGADVDGLQLDGGLSNNFQGYYSFLPPAPMGYAWTYGWTSEAQLIADGYPGNTTDGLYWFCLYPTGAGASEGQYRGFLRAQRMFSTEQMFLNAGGASTCGRPFNVAAGGYPAPVVITLFVRYVPDERP